MIKAEILLSLIRQALTGNTVVQSLFDDMSLTGWEELMTYSSRQGVTAIAFSGVEESRIKPPREILLKWLAASESIKRQCQKKCIAIERFAGFLAKSNIKILVFKGIGLASYYPDPMTREFGDMDMFSLPIDFNPAQFEDAHDATNKLIENHGIKIEYWDKHDIFDFEGLHIEHHSFFLGKRSESGRMANKKLLSLISENTCRKTGNMYFPSADFNAIYILQHTVGHMSYEGATIRNVLDWGLFLKKDGDKVHWNDIRQFYAETSWTIGFNTLTRVSEMMLSIDLSMYYIGTPDQALAKRMYDTILDTTLHKESHLPLIRRVLAKSRRLLSHRWMYTSGMIPARFWKENVWGTLKEHISRPEQF